MELFKFTMLKAEGVIDIAIVDIIIVVSGLSRQKALAYDRLASHNNATMCCSVLQTLLGAHLNHGFKVG